MVFALLLIFTTVCFNTEARPLNDMNPESYVGKAIENIFNGFYIAAIKNSGGPSPGGKGHNVPNNAENILGDIKNSGPAPGGEGHEFVNVEVLGERKIYVEEIKNSGPTPGGKGQEFVNAETLGERKNSGPAPGGEGHGLKDAEILGEKKNSGPSPGGKGH